MTLTPAPLPASEPGRGVWGEGGGLHASDREAQEPAGRPRSRPPAAPPLTQAEQILWQHLRNRNFGGNFRRQRPIGPFIVDFYCHEVRLVVELDGESHNHTAQAEHDELRTEWFQDRGYRVLRFWNQDVLRDTDSVIAAIVEALSPSAPSPAPRERG
jgi:very-short-patch-repair endonuclease